MPNLGESEGTFFVPTTGSACKANIGRGCAVNVLTGSGKLACYGENAVGSQIKSYQKQIGGYAATAATKLSAASANFGVGNLGSNVAQSGDSVAQTSVATPSTQQTQSRSATQAVPKTSAPAPVSQSQASTGSTTTPSKSSTTNSTSKSVTPASGLVQGFAAGTTGGGNAKPVYPTTIKELSTYLSGDQARVIVLKQAFNFVGTEGKSTSAGCRPTNPWTRCDPHGGRFEHEEDGRLRQRGHLDSSDVVWGGDAISIGGSGAAPKGIWIDHVKVSNIGRQMVVVHFSGATGLTISYLDFDGNTKYSASCDGHHYWGFLLYGKTTQISLSGNYIHKTSGRSPKIGGAEGGNVVVHAANNYFDDNTGHAFDAAAGGYVLAEGNYFSSVKTPSLEDKAGNFFVPAKENDCKATIKRPCRLNVLTKSGTLAGNSPQTALTAISKYPTQIGGYAATDATKLTTASSNFGVGELSSKL